jgi:hypothetical protein
VVRTIQRLIYKYCSVDYLHAVHLMAVHYRAKRIRAGMCYAPGCQQDGCIWLDRAGIFCWDHYAEQMQAARSHSPHIRTPDEAGS